MTTINYHPTIYSGCKQGLIEFFERTPARLYSRGNVYKVEIMPFFADFPFTWMASLGIVLFNYQAPWPIQMLSINNELDYNSFISLN